MPERIGPYEVVREGGALVLRRAKRAVPWLRVGQGVGTLFAVVFVLLPLHSGVESDDPSVWFLFLLIGLGLSLCDKFRASVELLVNVPPFSSVARELSIDRARPKLVHRAPHSLRVRVDGRTIASTSQVKLALFETAFGRLHKRLHVGIALGNELCFFGTFRPSELGSALRLLTMIAEALELESVPSVPALLPFLPSWRSIQPVVLFDALVLGLLIWVGAYLSLGASLGLCLAGALGLFLLVLTLTGAALQRRVIERRARALFAEWGVEPATRPSLRQLVSNSWISFAGSALTLALIAGFSGRATMPVRLPSRPIPFSVPGATLCLMDLDNDGIPDPIGVEPRDPVERSYAPADLIALSVTTGKKIKEMPAPALDEVVDIACQGSTLYTLSQAGTGTALDVSVLDGSSQTSWHKNLPGSPKRLFFTERCVIVELRPRTTSVSAFAAIDKESGRDCVDYLGLDGTPENAGEGVDMPERRDEYPEWVMDWAHRQEARPASIKKLKMELMDKDKYGDRRSTENGDFLISASLDARGNQYVRVWGRDRATNALRWSKRLWVRVWDHLEVVSTGPYVLVRADAFLLAMEPKSGEIVWTASEREHP